MPLEPAIGLTARAGCTITLITITTMAKGGLLTAKQRGAYGDSVLQVRYGDQIMRSKPTSVYNPNTEGQTDARARFKLVSQLAATLAPIIAIPRNGNKTSRNQFVSENYKLTMATNGVAQITLDNVQLTKSNVGLPQIIVDRNSDGINVSLARDVHNSLDKVVYIVLSKNDENSLDIVADTVVSDAGTAGTFAGVLPLTTGEIVIYAYGMSYTSSAAEAKYGNMVIPHASDLAKLIVDRTIEAGDVRVTKTRGTELGAGDSQVTPTDPNSARVFLTALGNGSVSGAGTYQIGAEVTCTATPASGATFQGWRANGGSQSFISTANPYTFTIADSSTIDLIAVFYTPSSTGGNSEGEN